MPTDLKKEHYNFLGWYTQADCGGTQIADKYGAIPVVSVVNESNFDLSGDYIYLYAGFGIETYDVTLNFGADAPAETIKVKYNTPVSDIVYQTRVNEKAVLNWSKSNDGEIFNGKITGETNLYALGYAPIIELNTNGGVEVVPVVAISGSAVSLPIPTKENYKFLYWVNSDGQKVEVVIMPNESMTLKAVWQPKIVFNENGGKEVDDISAAAGESIALPVPEKNGYIFAGWYTDDKREYTTTTMPSISVVLNAGWYESKTAKVVLISSSKDYEIEGYDNTEYLWDLFNINLSNILPSDFAGRVVLNVHMKTKYIRSTSSPAYIRFNFYTQKTASSTYLLHSEKVYVKGSVFSDNEYSATVDMVGNVLYGSIFCNQTVGLMGGYYHITDYYVNVVYPDTATLYLGSSSNVGAKNT